MPSSRRWLPSEGREGSLVRTRNLKQDAGGSGGAKSLVEERGEGNWQGLAFLGPQELGKV